MLFLGLVSMTLPMEAQKIITTNEDGDNITPARDCWKADFATCVSNKVAQDYIFPVIFGSCRGATVQVIPADAGTATVTDDGRTVTVIWNRSGVFTLHVAVSVDYPFFTVVETRTKTVSVNFANQDYSNFTLSDVSTCPSPGTSFRLNSVTKGYVRAYYLSIYEVTKNGSWTGGVWWNSGWVCESYDGQVIDASTVNFPFVVGRKYRIKVAVHTNCSGWQETNGEIITIGDCRPTASALINGSGDNPINLFTCTPDLSLNNTSTSPTNTAPITQMRYQIFETTPNCVGTIVASLPQLVSFTSAYDLRSLFFLQMTNPGKWYQIKMEARNFYGWSDPAYKCINLGSESPSNAEFKLAKGSMTVLRSMNPDGVEIYDFTCALVFDNMITSNFGSLDYYRVNLWETNPITGSVLPTGYQYNGVNTPTTGSLGSVNFNTLLPGAYFYNLSDLDRVNKRFKVRLTVHNMCGESYQESFFKISTACHGCLVKSPSGSTDDAETLGGILSDGGEIIQTPSKGVAIQATDVLNVFPNPTLGNVTFHLNREEEKIDKILIMDMNGAVLLQRRDFGGSRDVLISLPDLPSGLYYYRVSTERGNDYIGKLVKQ